MASGRILWGHKHRALSSGWASEEGGPLGAQWRLAPEIMCLRLSFSPHPQVLSRGSSRILCRREELEALGSAFLGTRLTEDGFRKRILEQIPRTRGQSLPVASSFQRQKKMIQAQVTLGLFYSLLSSLMNQFKPVKITLEFPLWSVG